MADEVNPGSPRELTEEEFRQLIATANSGNEEALTKLRQVLDENPHVWRRVGDMAACAETALIEAISGKNRLLAESLPRVAAELKQSLTGPDPTPLEELAAQRIVVCWLGVHHVDVRCAYLDGGSRGWASFWSRAQDKAHKRYAAALKELATVQKLQGRPQHRPPSPPPSAEAASGENAGEKNATANAHATAGAEIDLRG